MYMKYKINVNDIKDNEPFLWGLIKDLQKHNIIWSGYYGVGLTKQFRRKGRDQGQKKMLDDLQNSEQITPVQRQKLEEIIDNGGIFCPYQKLVIVW